MQMLSKSFTRRHTPWHLAVAWLLWQSAAVALAQMPVGEVHGTAVQHTQASAQGVVDGAAVVLPAAATGGAPYVGLYRDAPSRVQSRVPVVVFLHGSSGLGLKAIGEWQRWLATLGVASMAPDSFALPDRVTYKSPVSTAVYEPLLALRASEIDLAVQALQSAPWADTSRLVLAGTSEGAAAVARYAGGAFAGRMVFSWSCERNYFVVDHRTAVVPTQPMLNIMSTTDPFFSPANPWLGNPAAQGHCAAVLKDHPHASIVLIPGAPHTLINLPQARQATEGFLREVLHP